MRLLAMLRVAQSLFCLILLAALLAFPVNARAETDSTPKAESSQASQSDTESAEAEKDSKAEKAESNAAAKPESGDSEESSAEAEAKPDDEEKAAAKPESEPEDKMAADAEAKSDSANEEKAATEPAGSEIVVTIDKAKQAMTVWVDGIEEYNWPVSTGMRGYSTPSGTYPVSSMNKIWYSKQWDNAPMPHSIFFTKKGHAIHGSTEIKRLGKPASHGCVRLHPKNAETLFTLVKTNGMENVKVVLTGTTPGGEAVVASPRRPKARGPAPEYGDPWFDPRYAERPRRRGGWFRRRYSGPDTYPPPGYRQAPPQGYYRQRRGLFFRGY